MKLTSGTKLGAYEILTPLGAGGMGEVYRARDTRLDREVALKVLPADFANDPDRLKRFEQEARATRRGTGYYKVPSLKGVWYRSPVRAQRFRRYARRLVRSEAVERRLRADGFQGLRRQDARGERTRVRTGIVGGRQTGAARVSENIMSSITTTVEWHRHQGRHPCSPAPGPRRLLAPPANGRKDHGDDTGGSSTPSCDAVRWAG